MNDKLKAFIKYASENEELAGKFESIKDETDKGKVIDFTVKTAKAHGFELTADDFTHAEMDDNELDAVSGGWKQCVCVVGGGGSKDVDGKICACVGGGLGICEDRGINYPRCMCCVGGYGNELIDGFTVTSLD